MTTVRLLSDPSLSLGDDIISGDMFQAFWRTLVYNRVGDSFAEEVRPDSAVGFSFACWYMFWKLYLTRKREAETKMFRLHLWVLQELMDPFVSIFIPAHGHRSFFVTDSGRMDGRRPPLGLETPLLCFEATGSHLLLKVLGIEVRGNILADVMSMAAWMVRHRSFMERNGGS